jgi:hypothetical protein
MGTITRSFANNLTTGGVLKADAFNNASLNNVTALNAAIATGGMVLVSSATASSSATIDFTLGNYKEYQFWLINIHPQTNDKNLRFNLSIDSGSNYNVTKTSSAFEAYHYESDVGASLNYSGGLDLAQSTGGQIITSATGADADQCVCGILQLFNPSSTTFVKHYISVMNDTNAGDVTAQNFIGGYANTTSALTNIRFIMESGNIDDGTILMYGIN